MILPKGPEDLDRDELLDLLARMPLRVSRGDVLLVRHKTLAARAQSAQLAELAAARQRDEAWERAFSADKAMIAARSEAAQRRAERASLAARSEYHRASDAFRRATRAMRRADKAEQATWAAWMAEVRL